MSFCLVVRILRSGGRGAISQRVELPFPIYELHLPGVFREQKGDEMR